MSGLFQRNEVIVCEGDSITNRGPGSWPFLRISGDDQNWANKLGDMFFAHRPDLNLSIHNKAVGGSTCRSMAGRYEEQVRPLKPKWVLFTLGGNDANHKIPISEVREIMGDYCRQLAKDSGGKLIYIRLPDRSSAFPKKIRDKTNRAKRPYLTAFSAIVRKHGGMVIDTNPGFCRKEKILRKQCELHTVYADGGHLSNLGSTVLVGEVLKGLGYGLLD